MTDTADITRRVELEEVANTLELQGYSHAADFVRRIELERADARKSALEDAILSIEKLENVYRNDLYRKAWKVAVNSLKSMILGIKVDGQAV